MRPDERTAGEPLPPVLCERNIPYARCGDRTLCLDLYRPADAAEPVPVVLYVYGGGWRGGNKEVLRAFHVFDFCGRGFALAAPDYRLSPEAVFPAQIRDCKAAVRFLRARAGDYGDYGLDGSRVGAWGNSAGGHLVSLLGLAPEAPGFEEGGGHAGHSSAVRAVCDVHGPSDFLALHDLRGELDYQAAVDCVNELLGEPVETPAGRERAERASPLSYVTADAPPFLILQGDRDRIVPPSQSVALRDALREAGAEAELVMVPGKGHGDWEYTPALRERMLAFFERHL